MKVRILNVAYYGESVGSIGKIKCPVEVEASTSIIGDHVIEVGGDEIRRLTGNNLYTKDDQYIFINPTEWNGRTVVMWEPVEVEPFAHWNRLKATRDAGAMPAQF